MLGRHNIYIYIYLIVNTTRVYNIISRVALHDKNTKEYTARYLSLCIIICKRHRASLRCSMYYFLPAARK